MKQVIFVNPDYYVELDEYNGGFELNDALPPIQSGVGEVYEEKGGLVTKIKIIQQAPNGKLYERIVDATNFLIIFVGLLNQLIPSVKILLSSIFGSKQTKANIREIKKIRREFKNYKK